MKEKLTRLFDKIAPDRESMHSLYIKVAALSLLLAVVLGNIIVDMKPKSKPIKLTADSFDFTAETVSMGNPHAVIFVDDIEKSGITKDKFTAPKSKKETVSFAKAAYWRKRKKMLQDMMWTHCGIVRTVAGLNQGLKVIESLEADVAAAIKNKETENLHFLEFLNALQVSKMILIAALRRKESRGLHYILDYPNQDPKTKHHTIYLDK